jgi:hypothetical protein
MQNLSCGKGVPSNTGFNDGPGDINMPVDSRTLRHSSRRPVPSGNVMAKGMKGESPLDGTDFSNGFFYPPAGESQRV